MTTRNTLFTRLLRGSTALCGAVPAGLILFAAPAYAQDAAGQAAPEAAAPAPDVQAEETGNSIVVTGSLFRRTNAETPSPVTVLSAETLQQRGLNTVSEALQRVSAGNAGTISQGWNNGSNFAAGANAIALRGLTVQATLTMFDGLRMAPYPLADDGQRNFVDLNTIPNAIIERIDVLRDGASSTYGADAVAGVINVITKKEVKGLHANFSAGISEHGDAGERRADLTWGYGDLKEQGFNFYLSGEYMKQDALWARDRGYPFNTLNYGNICNAAGSCMQNLDNNGVSQDGSVNGFAGLPGVAAVRPVNTAGDAIGEGRYSYLNPALGCGRWSRIQLTAQQVTDTENAPADGRVCTGDLYAAYAMLQPEVERFGFSTRFTANIGEAHQLYVQGNFYQTDTAAWSTPRSFNERPASPRSGATYYYAIAPVYVCAAGVGTRNGLNTGCTAANGTLNPYNPYAGSGRTAEIQFSPDLPTSDQTSARSLRGVVGLSGTVFKDWDYQANFVASRVELKRTQTGYFIPQRLMDVVARGTFNFANPSQTAQSVWDYISPDSLTSSVSNLWQGTANVSHSFFDLPGGPLNVAAGLAYRHESIDAPSANPQNDAHPYDRYYSINAVGTSGARNVFSAFGEIEAPIFKQLEVNLSGRYDSYSTGQKNFSPKVGAKFTPIPQVALRGTWSKGFRIPSFNEAFGLPTTGFVGNGGPTFCTDYAAFCAAHGNNAYATTPFSIGQTNVGNPELKPEKSQNFTLGAIFEPIRGVSFTVDLWRIKVRDQIVGVTDTGPIIDAYYNNNGVVNIPGIVVTPGAPDLANPNALPHIGFIQASYTNASQQLLQGVDFGVNAQFKITDGLRLISSFEASYLDKNHLTLTDLVTGAENPPLEFEGTLSPCNVTSCSGAPRWRGSWQNTLLFGNTSITGTLYYTSGYSVAELDVNADDAADCSHAASYLDGSPVMCHSKAVWNFDLTASHKLNDQFTIYVNALNVLNIKPPFDPNAAYGGLGYNPAWAGPNMTGRFVRVGAKIDF
jgi:iron complex outermembrane receptor protein